MLPEPKVIGGHPTRQLELVHADGQTRSHTITICAECEQAHTIIMLTGDRWYCSRCRAEGVARPTIIPIRRRSRHG